MMLVDSSVWIDFLGAVETVQTTYLKAALGQRRVLTVDLVIVEVLQGVRNDRAFAHAYDQLFQLDILSGDEADIAVEAARHYRMLRGKGITIRKTIDTLIATRCIRERIPLLYSDRDFEPFVEHCNMPSALDWPFGLMS